MGLLGFLRVSKDCGFAHKGGCLLEKRENKRGVGLLGSCLFFGRGGLFDFVLFWGETDQSPAHADHEESDYPAPYWGGGRWGCGGGVGIHFLLKWMNEAV